MKRLFFAVFSFIFAQAAVPTLCASQQVYLQYTTNCMDLLEYRNNLTNNALYAYRLNVGANEQYVFYTGSGIMFDMLPRNTVTCKDLKINDELFNAVNALQRQMFIVQQVPGGHAVMPVTSITRIIRSAGAYYVSSPNYSFALDTTIVQRAGNNLTSAGSRATVVLSGYAAKECRIQYAFQKNPVQTEYEKGSFEFLPGIGITVESSGRSAAEAKSNEISLRSIDGVSIDDYIVRSCGGVTANKSTVLPTPVGPAVIEPRPEDASRGAIIPTGAGFVNGACPNQSEPGYHVVQPKEGLMAIARRYNVSHKSIMQWNKITNPDKVSVCQVLRVAPPGAKGIPTAPTKSAAPKTPAAGQQTKSGTMGPVFVETPTVGTGDMPDLVGGGATTNAWQDGKQPIHVVQAGETLYGIASKYGYTEKRFREINKSVLPANGSIQTGMRLYASDCACATAPAGAAPKDGAGAPPKPLELSTPSNTKPSTPDHTNTKAKDPELVQLLPGGTPTVPNVNAPANPNDPNARIPIGYKDYQVRQSESLREVAIKHNVNLQELATLNGKDVNEILVPGQKLQIPIY